MNKKENDLLIEKVIILIFGTIVFSASIYAETITPFHTRNQAPFVHIYGHTIFT